MIIFQPTWDALITLVGLEHGRVLTDDDKHFILWECTAFPMAGVLHIQRQLHEALTEPRIDRCVRCGAPKGVCAVIDDPCCGDCHHPAHEEEARSG